MMTCRELYDFLDAFLEGSLEASTRIEFDEHLRECGACRCYLASYRATVDLARAAERGDEPATTEAPTELVKAILRARAATTTES